MTRSDFPTRLAGSRFTSTNESTAEAIKTAITSAYRRNCRIDHLFCAPEVFNDVEMSMQGQRRYADVTVGKVGFSGIEFSSMLGRPIKLFADPDIPKDGNYNIVAGIRMDAWDFKSAEGWPQMLIDGGKETMTEASSNALQGRVGGYGQIICSGLKDNFVLSLQ
jgi:hypothetical protein